MKAETLATVLAADKGVALSKEALEECAASLAPFAFPEREGAGDQGREHPEKSFSAPPDAEALAALAGKAGEERPAERPADCRALRILNHLPGRDGKRWMTHPFELDIGGTLYRVSLSLLLRAPSAKTGNDILLLSLWAGERRRFFRMIRGGAGSAGEMACVLEVFPEMPAKGLAALERELQKRFAGLAETVTVRNGGGRPPLEGFAGEGFPSVDETV